MAASSTEAISTWRGAISCGRTTARFIQVGPTGGVSGETPIAVLPMYDFPWTAAANDALWASISARLAEAGVQRRRDDSRRRSCRALAKSGPHLRSDLRLSLCDRPQRHGHADRHAGIFISRLRRRMRTEASSSAARADSRRALGEFRGAVAALNAHDSNTGMNLFRATIAPIAGGAPFFSLDRRDRLARSERDRGR